MGYSKRSLGSRVYMIAEELEIEQKLVSRVVNRYFSLCRDDVFNGKTVRVLGFVEVVPNIILSNYIDTSAMYCKRVSEIEGITYFTVKSVMRKYFDGCKEDLFNGKTVDFRSLATLHPIVNENGVVNIHSSLSVTINSELQNGMSVVTSARAHLCKVLKSELQRTRNGGDELI